MTRVAAIDVGTNSVRLLVTDGTADVARDLVITRLGEGVDASKKLAPDALRRTATAVETYANKARAAGAEHLRIAATSAVRDAVNRDEFCDLVYELTRVECEVLSGGEEARTSFAGVAAGLDLDGAMLVCDIGGGSTEFVAGEAGDVSAWISIDVGAVRLTERHIGNDPPKPGELEAVRADARAAASEAAGVLGSHRKEGETFVGVAGTITTLAAVTLGLERYEREAIHGATLVRADLGPLILRLASMTSAERRGLPAMPSGREDVIVTGAVLLEESMDVLGFEHVVVSESDILDGLALALLA